MREEGNAPKRGYPSRHQAAQAFPVSSESLLLSVEGKTQGGEKKKKKRGQRLYRSGTHPDFPCFGNVWTRGNELALNRSQFGCLDIRSDSISGGGCVLQVLDQSQRLESISAHFNNASTTPMWRMPSPIETFRDRSTHWKQRLKIARLKQTNGNPMYNN